MPNYGVDLATHGTDPPDLSFRQINGKRAIAEAVARRWLTPRGSLVTDSDAGVDLGSVLGGAIDQTALFWLADQLQTEAEKDERVGDCSVTLTYDPATSTLRVDGAIDPATPDSDSFEFVFTLDSENRTKLEVR